MKLLDLIKTRPEESREIFLGEGRLIRRNRERVFEADDRPLSRVYRGSRILIEVRRPRPSLLGKYILVQLVERKLVRRHLLWHLLYRGVTALEWFILYYDLEHNDTSWNLLKKSLYTGLLIESSNTRERLVSFNSRTRPIFKTLGKCVNVQKSEEELAPIRVKVHNLLKIPQKGLSTHQVYSQREVFREYKFPKEKRYVGVGYNDQGHLSDSVGWQSQYTSDLWTPSPLPFSVDSAKDLYSEFLGTKTF